MVTKSHALVSLSRLKFENKLKYRQGSTDIVSIRIYFPDSQAELIMVTKLLFWGSMLFIFLGFNAREGHLFFFFGIYLLMSAIGLFFRKREGKLRKQAAVEPLPVTSPPA